MKEENKKYIVNHWPTEIALLAFSIPFVLLSFNRVIAGYGFIIILILFLLARFIENRQETFRFQMELFRDGSGKK